VLKFWRNPEFVRHVRAELRPTRAVTVAVVVLFLCALIGLACWSERQSVLTNAENSAQHFDGKWTAYVETLRQQNSQQTWLLLCKWLFGLQCGPVTFWSLFACAQSVSAERDRKTWDFQRTTSLTPAEMLIGKLLGEPVLAYFGMLCVLPLTLIAGLLGGLSFWSLVAAYGSIVAGSLFLGLGGLWVSTLVETRSRGVGMIGALGLYGFTMGAYGFATSWFPGLAAFSPVTGLHTVLGIYFEGRGDFVPPLFGHSVPWVLLTLLLDGSFGAWLVLMLVRNLKRDYSEIRPLSRWQAVGCAAFLNFVFYALLKFGSNTGSGTDSPLLATFMVSINGAILFAMGLATLTPHERLKVWWRQRAVGTTSLFSEDGLPWPWLALSALVAYALMVWGLLAWRLSMDFHTRTLGTAAVQLLVVLVFITRDILFIQWCTLTRMWQPVLKGFFFLCLYYVAAAVVSAIAGISGEASGIAALSVLTPIGVFDPRVEWLHFSACVYEGLALQAGLIAVIVVGISNRLGRVGMVATASGD
jgi:hypothetical protein